MRAVRDATKPALRGAGVEELEDDLWRVTMFDFLLDEVQVDDRPVRLHLYGHEGLGFIGQPGKAKDMAYKSVHALIALASDLGELEDPLAVVEGDLVRLKSRDQEPVYVIAAPDGTSSVPSAAASARVFVEWRKEPLAVLRPAVEEIIRRHG